MLFFDYEGLASALGAMAIVAAIVVSLLAIDPTKTWRVAVTKYERNTWRKLLGSRKLLP